MKKFLVKMFLFTTLYLVCSFNNVLATNVYFTNLNGVEMNELQYNKMLKIFSERRVNMMTQEEFDKYKDSNIVSSEVVYEKETYKNKELISTERITEEEFNNAPESEASFYAGDSGYIETSYKRLSATISDKGGWLLTSALSWKKKPAYQSYDVYAYRFTHFNYYGFVGQQIYIINDQYYIINYNTSSEGYKPQSNGAGVSMNLKDGSNITGYELTVATNLAVNTSSYYQAHAYVSYQHAQANVTRAQSMDYKLDVTGLGNVVKFNNKYTESLYDSMGGIHLSAPINQ